MVERLCRQYGTPLLLGQPGGGGEGEEGQHAQGDGAAAAAAAPLALHAFPTIEQLGAATEEELRDAGFGYRAKFVTGSAAALAAKPGGGEAWLLGLREASYAEAAEALCTLPGVGPKVAACICLFALDKHEAIPGEQGRRAGAGDRGLGALALGARTPTHCPHPHSTPVDTHVWQLACRYYAPHLRGKALTKKVHGEVQDAFESRFGRHAGWAHQALFISELASMRERVPSGGGGGPSTTSGSAWPDCSKRRNSCFARRWSKPIPTMLVHSG